VESAVEMDNIRLMADHPRLEVLEELITVVALGLWAHDYGPAS